jgi:hypothetical protein
MLISVAAAGLEKMVFEFGVPVVQGATTAPPPTEAERDFSASLGKGEGVVRLRT